MMKEMIAVNNLSKTYNLYAGHLERLKEVLSRGAARHAVSYALRGVSFRVKPGETVGIIGRNGSGKSTLLRILAGISSPSEGAVTVQGRVAALIELGAGFHPEYTGIENIYLTGTINGFSREETAKKVDGILEFAEIGGYASQPVKTYSSGMFVRLAFAVAVSLEPDILLVDEALAVGDYRFQAKCYQKFEELKRHGVTVLFVSHDADAVRRLCDRVIWLEQGQVRMDGGVREVTARYMEFCVAGQLSDGVPNGGAINRFGSRIGSVTQVRVDPPAAMVGEEVAVTVWADIPAGAEQSDLSVSVAVKNRYGLDLAVLSTFDNGQRLELSGPARVQFRFVNRFNAGQYALAVGLEDRSCRPISYYDYIEGAAYFKSVAGREQFGLLALPCETEVEYEQ